jgi:hypothetical protein
MADASVGNPLGYRHAVVLWSAQTVQGTAVTPASSGGIATARRTKQTGNVSYRGPGSPNRMTRKGGMTSTEWDLRFPAVQSGMKTLLQKGVRTSGVLPFFTLGLGYKDDVTPTANKDADQIQDCKVSRLRLGLDCSNGHAPLTADLSGIGGLITDLTSLSPVNNTSTPFWSYEGVFTKAAAAYELRSFEVNIDHNLKADAAIRGAAPGSFLRGWSYLTEKAEMITGQISRYTAPGFNVQADAIPAGDLLLVLTNVVDATTLTITLTDCTFGDEEKSEDENGIFWSFPFEATTWGLT